MKRLMIVADNSFAAQSIRLALRQTTGFQIIGFVDGETPLTARICELGPELVLVDDMQEPESAYARLRELAKEVPQAKRIVLMPALRSSSPRWFTPSVWPRCCERWRAAILCSSRRARSSSRAWSAT
jgi:CheY-like chemotaxis protein